MSSDLATALVTAPQLRSTVGTGEDSRDDLSLKRLEVAQLQAKLEVTTAWVKVYNLETILAKLKCTTLKHQDSPKLQAAVSQAIEAHLRQKELAIQLAKLKEKYFESLDKVKQAHVELKLKAQIMELHESIACVKAFQQEVVLADRKTFYFCDC